MKDEGREAETLRARQKQRREAQETALNLVSGVINKVFKEHHEIVGNFPI